MAEIAVLQNEAGVFEETPDVPQKYHYPEFAGWSGERYLKKLLRQILSNALYRTWEIFADHQAQDNACYLGVSRLAEMAGRNTRTMEKNLASLCAKQLLVERAERKLFRSADGRSQSRVVVIKDFGGLYTLAHDYHEWLSDPNYIAPDRALMALVVQEPQLVARLRRFENYRHLLYHRPPGPATKQREEDLWFLTYQSKPTSSVYQAEQAEGVSPMKNDPIPATLSANYLTRDLARDSPKRRNERTKRETEERDSVDSIDPSLVSVLEERESALIIAGDDEEGHSQAEKDTPASSALRPAHEVPIPVPETALAVSDLAASFLYSIGDPFGDRNPKGSQTRLCDLLRETRLSEPALVVHCLVRAYLVARDTRTIRSVHCSPTGGTNRMPLFFAMVQRFLGETAPVAEESWHVVEDALLSDPCLTRWWNTHQHLIPLPSHPYTEQEVTAEAPATAATAQYAPHRKRLSQNETEREARAALAHSVLRHLGRMGVVLQDGMVLWEHLPCGCPLYHRPKGHDVCALCCPDPSWPEEALVLLRSIVEPKGDQESKNPAVPAPVEADASGEQANHGWTDRDAAYQEALHLLDALSSLGYAVEVFLELVEAGYQVVVRDDQSEWLCNCPEHIDALLSQVTQSMPDAHEQCMMNVRSTV